MLTERSAIVQYLADLKPAAELAPPQGSWQRVQLQEWLGFISTEIHAGAAPMFNSALPEAARAIFRDKLAKRVALLETTLQRQAWLLGDKLSIADAYLYTVLGWFKFFDISLNQWPAVAAYESRIAARPSVPAALQTEAEAA